jgi:DNA-binding transcriptional regulator YiaG
MKPTPANPTSSIAHVEGSGAPAAGALNSTTSTPDLETKFERSTAMTITGDQIRAARAFLDWTIADLARAAEISDSTIRAIEKPATERTGGGLEQTLAWRANLREQSIAKLADALTAAGITFLHETAQGAGLRGKHKE